MVRSHLEALARAASFCSIALLTGCSGNAMTPPGTEPPTDLEKVAAALDTADGALTTADEPNGFDDPEVASLATFSPRFADATDPTVEVSSRPGARRWTLAIFWGHLPPARDALEGDVEAAPMSWTGSLAVDAGAIRVVRTLRFEDSDAVEPRTDPRRVAFTSRTMPQVDGVLVDVAVPPGIPAVLHLAMNEAKTDVPLATLSLRVGGVERLADGRNGIVHLGFEQVAGCARGLVFGRWGKLKPGLGVLRGIVGQNGEAIGAVRGIWGHAQQKNEDVFFGKYIRKGGAFGGLFGGTYEGGALKGVWGSKVPRDTGTLEGFYSDGYEQKDGRGIWLGRWSERCALR